MSDIESSRSSRESSATSSRSFSPCTLSPTKKFTSWQIFYIFGLDGIGAMLISGGINFGVAYAMYGNLPPTAPPIHLLALPNTLAGDAAVTILIQTIITRLIQYALVNRDLRLGTVPPIGFISVPRQKQRLLRWFTFADTLPNEEMVAPPIAKSVFARAFNFLAAHAARAFVVAVVGFLVLWGPCVGVLMAVGEKEEGRRDWVYDRRWTPQVFKLVLGAVLGGFTSPLFAFVWMVRRGWAVDGKGGVDGSGETHGKGEMDGRGMMNRKKLCARGETS